MVEGLPDAVLRLLAVVPLLDWSHVSDDPAVDLGLVATCGACVLLSGDVAVCGAYAEGWGQCEVGDVCVLRHLLD